MDKNYTDTELALRRAMEWAPESILLLGATGTRLDHTLANIHLLRLASEAGSDTAIEDADNRIRLLISGTVAGSDCRRLRACIAAAAQHGDVRDQSDRLQIPC